MALPKLFEGTPVPYPKRFEGIWEKIPERLEGKAFILSHIEPHFGEFIKQPQIRNRFHTIINQEYFESYTRDLRAGILTELIYLNAGYPIKSHGPNLPYRPLLNELRKANLLSHIQKCSSEQLLQLRDDPRWIRALSAALHREKRIIHTRRQFYWSKPMLQPRKSFIVHGHDKALLFELKDYLQRTLKYPEPIVLMQQPSGGRTIIEKFEDYADKIELAFVLMTPDDAVVKSAGDQAMRARQNVIFELGYFVGKFGRRSGRVLLLYRLPLDIPSDLHGVVYIDVSNGIEGAGEQIRRELSVIQD